jgi:hypothetical protein
MLIKEGVWEGPFIELQRSVLGPRCAAGRVHMWQCPACGTLYYHADPHWTSHENEVNIERIRSSVLILPSCLSDRCKIETRSRKHHVWPGVFEFAIAKRFRFVPTDFLEAMSGVYAIATFKSPKFAYERTLIANEVEKLNVPKRVCAHCYARSFKSDSMASLSGSYFFRPLADHQTPRIYSPTQPRVEVIDPSQLWSFDVKPRGVKVLLRRYSWGHLGTIIAPKAPIIVNDVIFEAKHVEFTNV